MASVCSSRAMALLCLVTMLVLVGLIGQTKGDIDVASSFMGEDDLLKGAGDDFKEKAHTAFPGVRSVNADINSPDRSGGDAASNANVNSASADNTEGFEEEEGTLGGDWRVIGH